MNEQRLIAAEAMARAVTFDPQFAMPRRPHFPAELVVIPMEDGLLIDGADDKQLLRGKATRNLLPRLLPLMDGTRTLEQLAEALPKVPGESIRNAVALLYTRGLLEDSAADPQDIDAATCDQQTLAFFRRHVDVTRFNRSALEAMAHLARAQVAIYALGVNALAARAIIQQQLQQAGINSVQYSEWGTDPGSLLTEQAGKRLVIVLVEGEDDQHLLQELDERCARSKIPWLRAAVNPVAQMGELGPYFERGETACFACFARSISPLAPRAPQHAASLDVRLWANMLAIEAIYLLSRISFLASGLNVSRYDLGDWSAKQWRYPKLPGCPNCRPSGGEMGYVEPAVAYEDAVSFPSRHLIDPKSHQTHYRPSNLELAHDGKRYPSAEQVPLPDHADLRRPEGATLDALPGAVCAQPQPARRLDVAGLATLLKLGGGIRYTDGNKASKLQRWTPTGGNLGSVELYVLARNVEGLTSGIYFYQPHEHTLACLERVDQPAALDAFTCEALALEHQDLADAYLVLAAAHHRVAHKYAAFAYRIINLDAGVALGQIHMAARGTGLVAQTVQKWADDQLGDRLNLEHINEAVTGVLAIRGL